MRIKAKNFPHPVLNPVNDDVINSYFNALITEVNETEDLFEFTIQIDLENEYLQELISLKKASFNIHFECTSTMQRLNFSRYSNNFKIPIKKEILNKSVDVNFFILAEEYLESYKNNNAHTDYENTSFKIQKGDVLAFSVAQTIKIEKTPLANTNSIFKVSKNNKKNAPSFEVSLEGDQIEISLPEKSYELVEDLQHYGSNYTNVLVAIIYTPALIDTLFSIQDNSSEVSDLDWYRTLEEKIKRLNYEISSLEPENITKIAYDLLNESSEAPFESLKNITQE